MRWVKRTPTWLQRASIYDMDSKRKVKGVAVDERIRVLEDQRRLKMARSAHAYVRGSTLKFYEWLGRERKDSLPEGPAVWICGDCHAGNLGPVANADGKVEILTRRLWAIRRTI